MQREKKLRALRGVLGEYREKGEEAIFFCPKHGSRAGRTDGQLCVNLRTDWFNCWSCGFKGRSLVGVLRLAGNTEILREYLAEIDERKNEPEPEKKYDPPALPSGFRSLSVPSASPYHRGAMEYLSSRGLGTDDILRWKLGYCETGEYRNRIVIPSFDEHGLLNFVVCRSFYESDSYRYKPSPEHQCKDVIWNDYMIDWTQPVVVTEGPFDAFVARDNVTILQGTILGAKLLRKIVLSGVDVYFAMDADAFKRQLKHIELLLSYGVGCHYIDVRGKKDVGAMTREEFATRKARAIAVKDDLDVLKIRVSA